MYSPSEAARRNRNGTPFSWALLLYVACTASMLAQPRAELGVRVDAPVRGPMVPSPTLVNCRCGVFGSIPRHVAIGASVSIPILRQVRLRLDPAYQRIGVTETSVVQVFQGGVGSPIGIAVGKSATTANRWRVPILLEAAVARYVRLGIGPEVSIVTGSRTTLEVRNPFGPDINRTADDLRPLKPGLFGICAAVEFPFRLGPVTVAPEVRYKRWTGKHYGEIWAMDEVTAGLAIRH